MKKNKLSLLLGLTVSAFTFAQQSLTIDDAWQYAREHNVSIQKARIDKAIAQQRVKETIGQGLPQINAKGTYNNYLKIPVQLLPAEIAGGKPGEYVPIQFGQKHAASGGVTLSQLLFNGSYLVGVQSSKIYKETANLVEEKTELSIKEGILLTYTGILVTDENLSTLEENRKTLSKLLYDTEKTNEVGLIELQNVEQLQYSYKTLVTNIENLKRTRKKLLNSLKYVLGYPLDESLMLASSLPELIEKNEMLVQVNDHQQDISQHIDYRIKVNQLKISELQLKFQKSKSLPSLSGFISSTYNGNSNTFTFFDKKQKWFNTSVIGLQLDVPIFSGLQRHFRQQQAKLNVKKAELDLKNTQRELQNSIIITKVDYDNAYNSFKNAQDLIQLSSSIYKKQQIKFQEGLGTSFDLQQAETQLYDSQTKYYNAALNLIQAKTKLDQALGTL